MTMAEYLQQKGREQGEQKGEQQGLYKAAVAIAKNLLANGVDIDLISKSTNLSEEEIKKLMN